MRILGMSGSPRIKGKTEQKNTPDGYVYGLAVFTVGSLLCGLASNINQLIAFRVFQAVGGSMLVANGTIIVTDAFKRNELGKAMGILSMVMAVAFVVGPILGGFLTIIDWRLNFFFNVPIGIVVTIWAHLKLKEVAVLPKGETFDFKGMVLFTIAFLGFMIYLTAGFIIGLTSLPMLLSLVIAIVSFAAFLRVERRTAYPLMDLNLFKIKIFSYGQLSNLLNSIARGAVMILLILFFQGPRGYDPLWASILIIPLVIGFAITGPIGGYFQINMVPGLSVRSDWSYLWSVSWVLQQYITIRLTGYLQYGCSSIVSVQGCSRLRTPVPLCHQYPHSGAESPHP